MFVSVAEKSSAKLWQLIKPGVARDFVKHSWREQLLLINQNDHYRVFIGTSVSTFSFRIHEEREILGFDPKTTYNRFCGDTEKECEQPTHWKIVY